MNCQNCKATLPDSAKFCTNCGTKVDVYFCSNGHVLESKDAVCRYCPSVQDKNKISVSTIIENPSEIPASLKKTVVELENTGKPYVQNYLGSTRIVQDKVHENKDDNVGVLGWLVILDGEDKWRDFKIAKRKVSIGRSPESDVVLDYDQVSEKHASIRLFEDGLYITDLDSSNGTFVNDKEITRQKLIDNDVLNIGSTSMKFKAF